MDHQLLITIRKELKDKDDQYKIQFFQQLQQWSGIELSKLSDKINVPFINQIKK